jgi:hypothetical protein
MEQTFTTAGGLLLGNAAADRVAARGATPIAAPVITDNGAGTLAMAIAAGVGRQVQIHPLTSLATGLSTSAIDILTGFTPGYRGKVIGFEFVTTVAGTGSGASQVFNIEIGTTNLTGGVLTLTLASQATIGTVTAATAITAANTFSATDTISIEMAASGTVFTAGAGYFVIKLQNLDTADAFATLTSALVLQGLAAAA